VKLSQVPSKIIGVQLGDVTLNFIRPDQPPIQAKFALLNEEEVICGYSEGSAGWSERTLEALRALQDALEDDAMARIFGIPTDSASKQTPEVIEPPQF
jgi:hypothetical protein